MATLPIASKERLKELGLDVAQYGSCSEPDQRSIQDRGRVWINRGCSKWHGCPWKDGTRLMQPKDSSDKHPRPRNVKTKFIKPNPMGTGDRVINNYCSCYQFLGDMKRRDGSNREIAEVVGGEGDTVAIKSSERITNPDATIYFKPVVKQVVIPRFPDPTEVDELFEDVYAAKSRAEHKAKTEDVERAQRLGGPASPPDHMDLVEPDAPAAA